MTARNLSSTILRDLYCRILRIRMVEEKIAELYPEGQMRCPVHLCIGQEAVPAGVCANLSASDGVFSGHRSHGHYLAKGGDLRGMLAELYGKTAGCASGKGGSMHLIDLPAGFLGASPIVGSTIPIAVGAALGAKRQGKSFVTAVFFGEGATEEGVFHESVNFAVLHKLPVIFVCENNLYSVYSPLSVRQPRNRKIFKLVHGYGLESRHGNGNNVVEVYQLARRAVARARSGKGPVFLEFATYRWREHCGPNYDNDIGYRTENEFQTWKKRDPLRACEKLLLRQGASIRRELQAMKNNIQTEIEQAVAFAKAAPFPAEEQLRTQIYAGQFMQI